MLIENVIDAGYVTRYHTQFLMGRLGQTNASHQWGVAAIVLWLTGGNASHNLLMNALFHDIGEKVAGDVPFMFGVVYPDVRDKHRVAEEQAAAGLLPDGLLPGPMFGHEAAIMKLADRLEGLIFIGKYHPRVHDVEGVVDCFEAVNDILAKVPSEVAERALELNPFLYTNYGLELNTPSLGLGDEVPF